MVVGLVCVGVEPALLVRAAVVFRFRGELAEEFVPLLVNVLGVAVIREASHGCRFRAAILPHLSPDSRLRTSAELRGECMRLHFRGPSRTSAQLKPRRLDAPNYESLRLRLSM